MHVRTARCSSRCVSPVCSIVLSGGEEKGWVKFWPPRSARDVHPFTRKNTSKHFSRKFFENYLYANVKNFAPNYYTYWAPLLLRSPMMAEAHTWCVLAAMSVSATCTASRPHPTWPDQPSVVTNQSGYFLALAKPVQGLSRVLGLHYSFSPARNVKFLQPCMLGWAHLLTYAVCRPFIRPFLTNPAGVRFV